MTHLEPRDYLLVNGPLNGTVVRKIGDPEFFGFVNKDFGPTPLPINTLKIYTPIYYRKLVLQKHSPTGSIQTIVYVFEDTPPIPERQRLLDAIAALQKQKKSTF